MKILSSMNMDIMVKLNNQTVGRDKLIRLLQYGCRTYCYFAKNVHYTKHIQILKRLEFTFSSFRRLLRFGRCLDSLYQTLEMRKYSELMIKIMLIMAKLMDTLFLLADHIIWIGKKRILIVDLMKWNKIANKCWLLNIGINIIRDVYETFKIFRYEWIFFCPRNSDLFIRNWVLAYLKFHKTIILDTIKNICDLFIPLTALGHVRCSEGVVGIFGIISSLISLHIIINPYHKIYP